jgi:hypothetical protein
MQAAWAHGIVTNGGRREAWCGSGGVDTTKLAEQTHLEVARCLHRYQIDSSVRPASGSVQTNANKNIRCMGQDEFFWREK